MSLPVVVRAEAESEFGEAFDWYDDRAGLGDEFANEVQLVLDRISTNPFSSAVVLGATSAKRSFGVFRTASSIAHIPTGSRSWRFSMQAAIRVSGKPGFEVRATRPSALRLQHPTC